MSKHLEIQFGSRGSEIAIGALGLVKTCSSDNLDILDISLLEGKTIEQLERLTDFSSHLVGGYTFHSAPYTKLCNRTIPEIPTMWVEGNLFQDFKEKKWSICSYLFDNSTSQKQVINVVSELYSYKDFIKIENYISKNIHLTDLLIESHSKLVKLLDENAQFILDLDIDTYDQYSEQLFIRVISDLPIEEKLNILDKFESEWYFARTENLINIPVVTFTI